MQVLAADASLPVATFSGLRTADFGTLAERTPYWGPYERKPAGYELSVCAVLPKPIFQAYAIRKKWQRRRRDLPLSRQMGKALLGKALTTLKPRESLGPVPELSVPELSHILRFPLALPDDYGRIAYAFHGELSEWPKEHDWKSCRRQKRLQGSNP